MIRHSRALTAALGLAIIVGVGLRAWMLRTTIGTPDADEAVWTLMSRHVLDGELPVYFWGQGYGGTIEVYLAAPFVWAFGDDVTGARVLLLILGLVAALLVYVVGRRVLGSWRAAVAAAVFWVWPAYTAFKSTRVHGFYLSGQILVLLILLLVLRLAERPRRLDAVVLGVVLGLAAWQTLQVLPIVLPALLWLAWRRPAAYRLVWLAVPGLLLGSLPALVWNVRQRLWFTWHAPGGGTYQSHFHGFLTAVLPEQLGFRVPFTMKWLVPLPVSLLLVALAVVGVVYLLVRHAREPVGLLAFAALGYPFVYSFSPYTWAVAEPGYLFVLAPVIAILVVVPLRSPRAAVGGLVVIAAFSVVGLRALNADIVEARDKPSHIRPLVAELDRRGITRAVSEHWLMYPVILASDERIILGSASDDRYPPFYDAVVAAGPDVPHVYITGSADDERARPALLKRGYVRERVGEYSIWTLPAAAD